MSDDPPERDRDEATGLSHSHMLRDALLRLASGPDEQRAYLEHLGTYPSLDELALELEDEWPPAEGVSLGAETIAAIEIVRDKLGEMSGKGRSPDFWRGASLGTSPEWEAVRDLARVALAWLVRE